jgi:hypothetical protein
MNPDAHMELLYKQEQLPVFQNRMYATVEAAKACPKGDVVLVEDMETGLVYNSAFRPELMEYDATYQNEQALSPLFQEHLEQVSSIVERLLGIHSLVEVGCGKGFFLEMLLSKGFSVTGFDPTYEGTSPNILRQYFEPGVGVKAKGFVLRHVLEHVQDPYAFLLQLKEANGGSGKIYIEVPCFEWICGHRAWFDVFYEHVNYFRISDFLRMFGTVIESGRLFGNQYLYVVAELATLKRPVIDLNDRVRFPKDFTRSVDVDRPGPEIAAIWGGASKGVIFALLKARFGQPVNIVIDINPAKQGKFLPSTGLLVQGPSEVLPLLPKDAIIYVMNSNYLAEIKQMSNNAFNYVEVDHG